MVTFVWQETVSFLVSTGLAGFTDRVMFTITWNVAGMGFSILVASVYGVWYWIRMLERLPSYLDFWADKVGKRETEASESQLTRPVGVMVPPTMAIFATLLWVVLDHANGPGLSTLDILYAITWPLSMVGILATSGSRDTAILNRRKRMGRQSPSHWSFSYWEVCPLFPGSRLPRIRILPRWSFPRSGRSFSSQSRGFSICKMCI